MTNQLPENKATAEQYETLKSLITKRYPDADLLHIYASLSGVLSVGVSEEAMARLIELQR